METVIVNTRNAKYKVIDIHGSEYDNLNLVAKSKVFGEPCSLPEDCAMFEKDGKLLCFIKQNIILMESTGHNFEGYINE